jgi:hypothetical protein
VSWESWERSRIMDIRGKEQGNGIVGSWEAHSKAKCRNFTSLLKPSSYFSSLSTNEFQLIPVPRCFPIRQCIVILLPSAHTTVTLVDSTATFSMGRRGVSQWRKLLPN